MAQASAMLPAAIVRRPCAAVFDIIGWWGELPVMLLVTSLTPLLRVSLKPYFYTLSYPIFLLLQLSSISYPL